MAIDKISEKINQYISKHPEYRGKSEDVVLSAMVKSGVVTQSEVDKAKQGSTFGEGYHNEWGMGVTLERTTSLNPTNSNNIQTSTNNPFNFEQAPATSHMTDEQAKDVVISTISNDAAEARTILMMQDNGVVSDLYNKYKEYKDKDLSLSNVEESIQIQQDGANNLYKAKENKLSKREYFLENREHLKAMMTRRLFRKDENTGLDFLDRNRGNMNKEDFAKMMEEYINEQIDKVNKIDSLKKMQHTLLITTDEGVDLILKNYKTQAEQQLNNTPIEGRRNKISTSSTIPIEYDDATEPMTFEEVFKLERNREYSKENIERYLDQKEDVDYATGAYNKYQTFKVACDEFLTEYQNNSGVKYNSMGLAQQMGEPDSTIQAKKVVELFTNYYANPINPDLAKETIEKTITENNLPIAVKTNQDGEIELDLTNLGDDSSRNRVLNQLVRIENQKLKEKLETTLGGDIEETMTRLINNTQDAYTNAYGSEFSEELAQAMAEDNKTFIQAGTGEISSTGGFVLIPIGGILAWTPLAPVGGAMVALGNAMAMGGMAAGTVVGGIEAGTRANTDIEEVTDLTKDFIMNAGGMAIGLGANKVSMKAFRNTIDKGLAEVFKQEISNGNKLEALKQVFTNPKYLASFMKSAGAKMGTDFIISYAGDLAMMGVLDTKDDWKSLLKANLIGIAVGMGGDIKDAAGVGNPRVKVREENPRQAQVERLIREADEQTKPDEPQVRVDEQQPQVKSEGVKPEPTIPEIKELTDAEFEAKKAELRSKMRKIKALKNINPADINKYSCQVLEEIINNPKLWNNKNFADNVGYIISYSDSPDRAKARISVINKITDIQKNNLELWNNKDFADKVGYIIRDSSSPDSANAITSVIDKIVDIQTNNPDLWNNKSFANEVGDIIHYVFSPDSAKAITSMIDKIVDIQKNSPELWNNENFADNVGYIILHSDSLEKAKSKVFMIDKIMDTQKNSPELWNNENFADNVGYIIHDSSSPDSAKAKISVIDKMADIQKNNHDLWNNKNFADKVGDIIYLSDSPDRASIALETLKHPDLWNNKNFADKVGDIIRNSSPNSAKSIISVIDKIVSIQKTNPDLWTNKNFADNVGNLILRLTQMKKSSKEFLINQNIEKAFEDTMYQKQKALEAPDKYINGEYDSEEAMQAAVNEFFNDHLGEIMLLASVYDKEALNNLLRMRFEDATEYIDVMDNFDAKDLELLQKLSNSCNIDGKPFMPTQKVEFIDLLEAYIVNDLSLDKIQTMVKSGKVDIGELNIDLFNQIMKNSGLTDEEISSIPKEKLMAWDTKFAHLLSKEIQEENDVAFSDILRAGSLEPDFIKYIHDKNNVYGQANANTRTMYEQMTMDYEYWLHPSKENEIHFVSKDKNTERLTQIANQIREDMNTLMQTPVKGFLKKQFPKCIKGEEFIIPNEYLISKAKLEEFVKILADTSEQGQLAQVWNRAKGNTTNPDPARVRAARGTLTILDHLNQRLDDISKVQDGAKATKKLDLTIKMWDRIPQKDIFQGNYSTCCIAMGGGNGSAMPHYIMDTAFNMIELVDNETGKTIGNALCYFVKGITGKPSFIIDNIEINNGAKPSKEVQIQLRTAITEYASQIAKDVTGQENTPIYIGGDFNDVVISDLAKYIKKISFLGEIDSNTDSIYLDAFGETGTWTATDDLTQHRTLFKLK